MWKAIECQPEDTYCTQAEPGWCTLVLPVFLPLLSWAENPGEIAVPFPPFSTSPAPRRCHHTNVNLLLNIYIKIAKLNIGILLIVSEFGRI